MSTSELGDQRYDLSGFSSIDQKFLAKTINEVDQQPLARRIRNAIPMVLLVSSLGIIGVGCVLGKIEIVVGGVCLYAIWQHPQ